MPIAFCCIATLNKLWIVIRKKVLRGALKSCASLLSQYATASENIKVFPN